MTARVKGQDTKINFTGPQGLEEGSDEILNFESELDLEILEEEYLGETSKQFDTIYNGAGGSVEVHISTDAYFRFSERVEDRARGRTAAGGVFSASSSFTLPRSGRRVRLVFQDVQFGAMPLGAKGRKEYVSGKISWKCADVRRIL